MRIGFGRQVLLSLFWPAAAPALLGPINVPARTAPAGKPTGSA